MLFLPDIYFHSHFTTISTRSFILSAWACLFQFEKWFISQGSFTFYETLFYLKSSLNLPLNYSLGLDCSTQKHILYSQVRPPFSWSVLSWVSTRDTVIPCVIGYCCLLSILIMLLGIMLTIQMSVPWMLNVCMFLFFSGESWYSVLYICWNATAYSLTL